MELTEFDIVMMVTMSFAVISMSFVFPALGLATEDVSENEIPSFNITAERFNIAGEFPDSPGTPKSGIMDWNGSRDAAFSNNQIWLNGGTDGGYELLLLPSTVNSSGFMELQRWQNGNVTEEQRVYFNSTGQVGVLEVGEYEMTFEVTEYSDEGTYITAETEYQIQETPITNGGWLDRVPVVGGIYESTEVVAATLMWIGSIFIWFSQTTVETALNVIFVLVDTLGFFFNLAVWLTTTYSSIVSSAASWVSIFLALPGVLLSIVLGKIAFIGISLLPTT